jgi:hypothetical protein
MHLRVLPEETLAFHDEIDIPIWDGSFFSYSVTQYRFSPFEKIQNPILNRSHLRSELVNAVPKIVCQRPTQFVPPFLKQVDPNGQLRLNARLLAADPIDKGRCP